MDNQQNFLAGTRAHAHNAHETDAAMVSHKIDQAIKVLKSVSFHGPVVIAYSGGKDSDACLRLAQLAKVPFTLVHNCTTIDPPGTLKHCADVGAVIVRAQTSFFDLVRKKGLPSMFRRFCCSYLKEQYIAPRLVVGIRAAESVKRSQRYSEPTSCRIYKGGLGTEQVFPLLSWSDAELLYFLQSENVPLHPLYYDNGQICIKRRLGCMGCPLASDRGKSDFLKYPKLLRRLAIAYADYVASHKAVVSVYHDIAWQLFYSNHGNEKFAQTYYGLFPAPDPREFLCDFFHVDLPLFPNLMIEQ